jgi:hypothetical protein
MRIAIKNSTFILVVSFFIAVLSAYCAIRGFVDDSLYGNIIETGVFRMAYMSGTISQDIITIASSIAMLILIPLFIRRKDVRIFISIIGLLSFYFYAYGVYLLSALYTSLYAVYMIIFTLSLFGMVIGISSIAKDDVRRMRLPKWISITSSAFLGLIVCIFVPMWISNLIPFTQSHVIPDFHAIFILDLCLVMPFFAVVIYMLIRDYKMSYVLLGVALLKTITLILSVLIGESTFPAHGFERDIPMIVTYGVITVFSLVLFIYYLIKINFEEGTKHDSSKKIA